MSTEEAAGELAIGDVVAPDCPKGVALAGGFDSSPPTFAPDGQITNLIFPLALAFMAWQSSIIRAMMSATGLLYIAMGGVLAGEVLARALLFSTARPL